MEWFILIDWTVSPNLMHATGCFQTVVLTRFGTELDHSLSSMSSTIALIALDSLDLHLVWVLLKMSSDLQYSGLWRHHFWCLGHHHYFFLIHLAFVTSFYFLYKFSGETIIHSLVSSGPCLLLYLTDTSCSSLGWRMYQSVSLPILDSRDRIFSSLGVEAFHSIFSIITLYLFRAWDIHIFYLVVISPYSYSSYFL